MAFAAEAVAGVVEEALAGVAQGGVGAEPGGRLGQGRAHRLWWV